MKKLIVTLAFASTLMPLVACTTAVISGKYTPDGRPMLWKNRDTGDLDNKLMYFTNAGHDHIGLVNSRDKTGTEIWAGMNITGFAIMNSASYNLNIDDAYTCSDKEGELMKLALLKCSSVDEFEILLQSMEIPYCVEANFGVIDASGAAAWFEVSNTSFIKIDVNDPTIAPQGYVIHTNYSFTGMPDQGQGYIRFASAQKLFYEASSMNNLTPQFLLGTAARSFYHGLTQRDLVDELPENDEQPWFTHFTDYIPRFSTSASVVIQGIREKEDPGLTTMYTVLGFPLCSVVTPVWFNDSHRLPAMVRADNSGSAPLCDLALDLKKFVFPVTRGHGKDYIDLSQVMNREGTGIMQQLKPVEEMVFQETFKKLEIWRQSGMKSQEVVALYDLLDTMIPSQIGKILFTKSNSR